MSIESNIVAFAEKVKSGFETAGSDALKVAAWIEGNQTEITALAALAGTKSSNVTATGTSLLNTVAGAVEAAGDAASANGLNVSFDSTAIAAVKAVIAALKKI